MERVTSSQKVVTTQRQPGMKDVNINVTISIPTGVQLSGVEEGEQSTLIKESVLKSFQTAAAPGVQAGGTVHVAPPAAAKSVQGVAAPVKASGVKAPEPARGAPKAASVSGPARRGSKMPLPQIGLGLAALAGLYALQKGFASRRREKKRPASRDEDHASGEGMAVPAAEGEAEDEKNGQSEGVQKVEHQTAKERSDGEEVISGEASEAMASQEGRLTENHAFCLELPAHIAATAEPRSGTTEGLYLAQSAVSRDRRGQEGLTAAYLHASELDRAAERTLESAFDPATTSGLNELGTRAGESMEGGGEDGFAQQEEEVTKRVDKVLTITQKETATTVGNGTNQTVELADGVVGGTGTDAKAMKKPRVKKLKKRVRSVTKKVPQESAAEPGADLVLAATMQTLDVAQTGSALPASIQTLTQEPAEAKDSVSEGLETSQQAGEAPVEETVIDEQTGESAAMVEAERDMAGVGEAKAEAAEVKVEQNETPDAALTDTDAAFEDAESVLEETAEEATEEKGGEALRGRTSAVSVLEIGADTAGDKAPDLRVQQAEKSEELDVPDAQRWGIGWDLAEIPGLMKTDEAPEGWSSAEESHKEKQETARVEDVWTVTTYGALVTDEDVWGSTVTSLEEEGDVSRDEPLWGLEGEPLEEGSHAAPEEALQTARLPASAPALPSDAGMEIVDRAQGTEEWSDAVTWHSETESPPLEEDNATEACDRQFLHFGTALSVLEDDTLGQGQKMCVLAAEGAVLALEAAAFAGNPDDDCEEIEKTVQVVEPPHSSPRIAEPPTEEHVALDALDTCHVAANEPLAVSEAPEGYDKQGATGVERAGLLIEKWTEIINVRIVEETGPSGKAGLVEARRDESSENWAGDALLPRLEDRGIELAEGSLLLGGAAITAGGAAGEAEFSVGAEGFEPKEDELASPALGGASAESEQETLPPVPEHAADLALSKPVEVLTVAVRGDWPVVAVGLAPKSPDAEAVGPIFSADEGTGNPPQVDGGEPAAPQVMDLGQGKAVSPGSPVEARFFVEEPEEFALVLAAGSRSPPGAGVDQPGAIRVVEIEEPEVVKAILPESLKKLEAGTTGALTAAGDVRLFAAELKSATDIEEVEVGEKSCSGGASEVSGDGLNEAGTKEGLIGAAASGCQGELEGECLVSKGTGMEDGVEEKDGRFWQLISPGVDEFAAHRTAETGELFLAGTPKKPMREVRVANYNPLYDTLPSPRGDEPGLPLAATDTWGMLDLPSPAVFVSHDAVAPLETRAHKVTGGKTVSIRKGTTGVVNSKRRFGSKSKRKEVPSADRAKGQAKKETGSGRGLRVAVWGWWDSAACERTAAVIVVLWVIALLVAVFAYLERERSGAAGKPPPT